MSTTSLIRRLRNAATSAVIWGAGWAAGSFVVFQALLALGRLPESMIWADGLMVAARLGPMGAVVGGAFSLFIGYWYRGRRLSEIDWKRFAVTGGVLAGVYVPAFLVVMSVMSGDGLAFRHIIDDALLATLFGAVMAGGSMKLAQSAEPGLDDVANLTDPQFDTTGMLPSPDLRQPTGTSRQQDQRVR